MSESAWVNRARLARVAAEEELELARRDLERYAPLSGEYNRALADKCRHRIEEAETLLAKLDHLSQEKSKGLQEK